MSETLETLRARCAPALEAVGVSGGISALSVQRAALSQLCTVAKELGFNHLACISGVDYPEQDVFEVVYHLYSYGKREPLVIKARCPRTDPSLPSVTGLWKAALFLERETYDLLGIRFDGHPNLQRILLPEPWVGHPLRKDYDMAVEQFVSKGPQGEDAVSAEPGKGW